MIFGLVASQFMYSGRASNARNICVGDGNDFGRSDCLGCRSLAGCVSVLRINSPGKILGVGWIANACPDHDERGFSMLDLAYVVLAIVCFVAFACFVIALDRI